MSVFHYFMLLLGLALTGSGLFQPQLTRLFGRRKARVWTLDPRIRRAARWSDLSARSVQICLGAGLLFSALSRLTGRIELYRLSWTGLVLAGAGVAVMLAVQFMIWRR